jgi:hypothetical protein
VKGLNPRDESGVELPGIEQLEDAAQGIMGRDAVGEFQEGFQPVELLLAVGFDLDGRIAAGDDATEGEDEEIDEVMFLVRLMGSEWCRFTIDN